MLHIYALHTWILLTYTVGFQYCYIPIKGPMESNRFSLLARKKSLVCGSALTLWLLQNFRGAPLRAKLNAALECSVFHFIVHYGDEWTHREWIRLGMTPKSPQLSYLQQRIVFHSDRDALTHDDDASLWRGVSGRIPALRFLFVFVVVVVVVAPRSVNLWRSRSLLSLSRITHLSACSKQDEPLLWGRLSALNTTWFNYILQEESPHGAEASWRNRPKAWKLTRLCSVRMTFKALYTLYKVFFSGPAYFRENSCVGSRDISLSKNFCSLYRFQIVAFLFRYTQFKNK